MNGKSEYLPQELQDAYDVLEMTFDSGYTWLDNLTGKVFYTHLENSDIIEKLDYARSELQRLIDALDTIESYIPKVE